MPKLVFKVLWNTLESGKPVAAYVKNISKDGTFYWVFATVYPIPNGYLSIRLKPSSSYFKVIPELYCKLLEVEKQSRSDWFEAGLTYLSSVLKAHGFQNYEAFMISALSEELKSRAQLIGGLHKSAGQSGVLIGMGRRTHFGSVQSGRDGFEVLEDLSTEFFRFFQGLFETLEKFSILETKLSEKSRFVVNLAEVISIASLNASFKSVQLGAYGRTLSVVARELTSCANEVKRRVQDIKKHLANLKDEILRIQFQVSSARFQVEMIYLFVEEALSTSEIGPASESAEAISTQGQKIVKYVANSAFQERLQNCEKLLHALTSTYDQCFQVLNQFVNDARDLEGRIKSLNGFVTQLEIIRKTGLMEAVKVREVGEDFVMLFQQMAEACSSADRELQDFHNLLFETRKKIEVFAYDPSGIKDKLKVALRLTQRDTQSAESPRSIHEPKPSVLTPIS